MITVSNFAIANCKTLKVLRTGWASFSSGATALYINAKNCSLIPLHEHELHISTENPREEQVESFPEVQLGRIFKLLADWYWRIRTANLQRVVDKRVSLVVNVALLSVNLDALVLHLNN